MIRFTPRQCTKQHKTNQSFSSNVHKFQTRSKSAVVVGHTTESLTAALSLQQKGFTCTLLHNESLFPDKANSHLLTPNATQIFKHLGCDEEIISSGQTISNLTVANHKGNTFWMNSTEKTAKKYNSPFVSIHAADINRVLHKKFVSNGGSIQRDALRGIEYKDDGVVVKQKRSFSRNFVDLVVGADGYDSTLRKTCFSDSPASEDSFSGSEWTELVLTKPSELDIDNDEGMEFWGQGRRFGILPLPNNRVYVYGCMSVPYAPPPRSGRALTSSFESSFREFELYEIEDIMSSLNTSQMLKGASRQENMMAPYNRILKKFNHGPSVLIGEAAHAIDPSIWQRTLIGVEDAYSLAQHVAHSGASIPDALAKFSTSSRKRADWMHAKSKKFSRVMYKNNPASVWLRDLSMYLGTSVYWSSLFNRVVKPVH
eukprot:gb/GECH01015015.1/.p1 GENE.gb/GECH01015015.1/~~gb/GECH01015015.1/.p1  ORF type:complete len:427 (+),score=66.84 gb/GECH01015015.1/:1-1281(+)